MPDCPTPKTDDVCMRAPLSILCRLDNLRDHERHAPDRICWLHDAALTLAHRIHWTAR